MSLRKIRTFDSGHPVGSKASRRVVLQKVIKDGHDGVFGKDPAWVTTALHEATHAVAYLRLAEHKFREIDVDEAITYGSGKVISSWVYAVVHAVGPVNEERMRMPADVETEEAKQTLAAATVRRTLEEFGEIGVPEGDDLDLPIGTNFMSSYPYAFAIVEHDWTATCHLAEHLIEVDGVMSSDLAAQLLEDAGYTQDGGFPAVNPIPWVWRYHAEIERQGDPDDLLAAHHEYMRDLDAA